MHDHKVVRAYPCRRALGSQSGTSVELDPSAEVETRALMSAEELIPVGWYCLFCPSHQIAQSSWRLKGRRRGLAWQSAHQQMTAKSSTPELHTERKAPRIEHRAALYMVQRRSTPALAQVVSAGIIHTQCLRHSHLRRTVRTSATTRRFSAVTPQNWSHSWEPSSGPMTCTCPPL